MRLHAVRGLAEQPSALAGCRNMVPLRKQEGRAARSSARPPSVPGQSGGSERHLRHFTPKRGQFASRSDRTKRSPGWNRGLLSACPKIREEKPGKLERPPS
jgi:hypothetical protein